jgi:hypothetical protein
MSDGWFVVPLVGSGSEEDPYRPMFADEVDGYSGVPDPESGTFVVRFFNDTGLLSGIIGTQGVSELTEGTVVSRLNEAFSADRSYSEWNGRFSVGAQ